MRIPIAALLLAATVVLPAAAGEASLSGKWQIQRSAAGNESQQECTFTQKDADLTGSCSSDRGPVEISGKVDGKSVTWTYNSESSGGPVTVVYQGTLDSADKITGKVTAVEFSIEGEFTATRLK
jgi:hypothetical protein